MDKLKERPELNNNDHAFSAWLFKNGWKGGNKKEITGRHAVTAFIKPNGDVICKVFYDNWIGSYRVFTI